MEFAKRVASLISGVPEKAVAKLVAEGIHDVDALLQYTAEELTSELGIPAEVGRLLLRHFHEGAVDPPVTLETVRASVCLTDAALADSAVGRAIATFDTLFKENPALKKACGSRATASQMISACVAAGNAPGHGARTVYETRPSHAHRQYMALAMLVMQRHDTADGIYTSAVQVNDRAGRCESAKKQAYVLLVQRAARLLERRVAPGARKLRPTKWDSIFPAHSPQDEVTAEQRTSKAAPKLNLFEGPHAGMYLSGYAADDGKKHTSLQAAQEACLADPTASGVTGQADGTFTLRKGTTLEASPSGEMSWAKINHFEGPHAGMYLSGYAADDGKKHTSLQAAQEACLADPTASGVTGQADGTFTLRKGATLEASPSGEMSWAKLNHFEGPHAGMYLPGYAADDGKKHTSLQAAQEACLADPTASGVTGQADGTFTLRKGTTLEASPSGEMSWVAHAPEGAGAAARPSGGKAPATMEAKGHASRADHAIHRHRAAGEPGAKAAADALDSARLLIGSYLENHKEAAFKSALQEPARYYFHVCNSHLMRDHVNVHGLNVYLCLVRGGLGARLPMEPFESDDCGWMGSTDHWAGLTDAAWTDVFSDPSNFGKDFEGIRALRDGNPLGKVGRYLRSQSHAGWHANPFASSCPSHVEQRAKVGDARYLPYLHRFAHFFTEAFLVKRMFETLNAESSPEYVGFGKACGTLWPLYKSEYGLGGGAFIEHLYDEWLTTLDVAAAARFFRWIGTLVQDPADDTLAAAVAAAAAAASEASAAPTALANTTESTTALAKATPAKATTTDSTTASATIGSTDRADASKPTTSTGVGAVGAADESPLAKTRCASDISALLQGGLEDGVAQSASASA